MKRYTLAERRQYEPPACPGCGHPVDQGWLDATMWPDGDERMYVVGRWECHTLGCPYNPEQVRSHHDD